MSKQCRAIGIVTAFKLVSDSWASRFSVCIKEEMDISIDNSYYLRY